MEKTIYKDENVTITNQKIIFASKSASLATFRAIEIRRIQEASPRGYKALLSIFAWGVLLAILNLTPILTGFLFLVSGIGIWWLMSRIWPYVIVADTKQGEEIIFSTFNKKYVEKIAYILSDALGVKLRLK
jgi:hypothetical protein